MASFKVTGGVLEVEPIGGGAPVPPLGIWGGANEPFPTPPIYIEIPPGSVDGEHPEHPIFLPVYPAHPIVIPPGAVDPGPPLKPAHPIVLPPYYPAHPIVIPPGSVDPGPPLIPAHPIFLPPVIWGPDDPRPTPPIVIPPYPTEPPPEGWVWGYTARYGWVAVPPGGGGKPQPLP